MGDIYLMGRTTYEIFWPGWSTQTTGDGPGPIPNRMHKYVISTTLSEAPWKETTIIRDNVVEEIAKMKQQPGKDFIIDCSATLVESLQGTGLIDEYRFLVEPFIMGRGRRFFVDGTARTHLRLVKSKTLPSGTLALIYQPEKIATWLSRPCLVFTKPLGMFLTMIWKSSLHPRFAQLLLK